MSMNFIYGFDGQNHVPILLANVFKVFDIADSFTAETTIWTPASGKKFRLMGINVAASASGVITLRDNTAGSIIYTIRSAGGANSVHYLDRGILSTVINYVLTIRTSVAAACSGTVWGIEE